MQKHVLMLTASTFILACGAIAASAQQVPDVPMIQQQPQILQQRQELERQLRDAQTPRRGIEDDLEDNGGMKGWRYGPDWRHHESWRRGTVGPGMTDEGGMMGPGNRDSGMMMRMLFSLMDSDGDGTISLQDFLAQLANFSRQSLVANFQYPRCALETRFEVHETGSIYATTQACRRVRTLAI